jgi:hypothetical protein
MQCLTARVLRAVIVTASAALVCTDGALAQQGNTWHVDDDAPPGGDGTEWPVAFDDLQDALAKAQSTSGPDEIRVAQGIYKPGTDESDSFELINDVRIYGGYAGIGADDPNERNITEYETILSGEIGDPGYEDNCYHVVSAFGIDPYPILDGFTISGGYAFGMTHGSGGGVYLEDSSVQIINCTIKDNRASYALGGGGVGCRFRDHSTPQWPPIFRHCVISNNTSLNRGGGVFIANKEGTGEIVTSTAFVGCIIENNTAVGFGDAFGGGLYVGTHNDAHANAILPVWIIDCIMRNNWAEAEGGGIAMEATTARIELRVINTLIVDNGVPPEQQDPPYGGGGIFNFNSNSLIIGCTFSGNEAGSGGAYLEQEKGGSFFYDGSTIWNSILWGNEADFGHEIELVSGDLFVDYSDVELDGGGVYGAPTWGDHNINNLNPFFASDDNYHLKVDSPCIDVGDTASVPTDYYDADEDDDHMEPTPDLDLRTRVLDGGSGEIVDLGAYERFVNCIGDVDDDQDVDTEDLLDLLALWGDCPDPCPADFDGDGDVDTADLLALLGNWGPCGAPGGEGPPQSIQDCIDRHGLDPELLSACIEGMIRAGTP